MDIKIEKPKGWRAAFAKKNIKYWIGGAAAIAIACVLIFGEKGGMRAEVMESSIASVTKGEFKDFVRITGQVAPISTVQLSPLEDGMVQEILVKEGSMVKKGDVIAILTNTNLDLQILNSEAELAEKQNILRETQVKMEQEKLNLKLEKSQLSLDIQRKKRTYEQYKALHDSKLIATEEYLQAKEDYELARDKFKLVAERQIQDSIYRGVQTDQMEESLANMHRNMGLIRGRVGNLEIKSPISGELGLLDIVLGQSVNRGQKIGQVNDLSNYKVEAEIDEHYIDRVVAGLEATVVRQDSTYTCRIRKVFPEVRNGQFKAELVFKGARPANMRSGQTYNMNLELGQSNEAILIPRGGFFQSTGGKWILVLDKDGKKAHRRDIRIGRQNPQYYEVLEGLEAGEIVITCSYDSFGNNETIILKQ